MQGSHQVFLKSSILGGLSMKFKKIIPIMTIMLVFTACGTTNETQEASTAEIVRTAVETTRVERGSIRNELTYAGNINPSETVAVMSKLSGRVEQVFYDIGDKVEEGDVLFSLDEADIRNQIRQMQTQIDVANQGVRSAQTGLNSVTGGQLESQVLQLQNAINASATQIESAGIALNNSELVVNNTELAISGAELGVRNAGIALGNAELALENALDAERNAQTTFTNTSTLYDAGTVPKADFDRAELGYRQAQAGVEQARAAVEQAKSGVEQAKSGVEQATIANTQAKLQYEQTQLQYEQSKTGLVTAEENLNLTTGQITQENLQRAEIGVAQAQASRASAQVQLDILSSTLSDVNVRAPIRGVISARTAVAGEFTSPQMPAFTVVSMEVVNVEVRVSEILINSLSIGQEVDVFVRTIGEEPIKGRIKTISPAADQTSTFPVRIEIENYNGMIKPGMFAEVRFPLNARDNAIVLPRNTVLEDGDLRYVFVNENDTVRKVYVVTGIDNGANIEIVEGLSEGDEVVTKGQTFIADGQQVNIVEGA